MKLPLLDHFCLLRPAYVAVSSVRRFRQQWGALSLDSPTAQPDSAQRRSPNRWVCVRTHSYRAFSPRRNLCPSQALRLAIDVGFAAELIPVTGLHGGVGEAREHVGTRRSFLLHEPRAFRSRVCGPRPPCNYAKRAGICCRATFARELISAGIFLPFRHRPSTRICRRRYTRATPADCIALRGDR